MTSPCSSGTSLTNSPHPVSCRCPAPADYCTLAPESDVPDGGKNKTQHIPMCARPAIFSRTVTEAADTLCYLRCIFILPDYRWDEQWKFTGQPARVTVGRSACSDLDSTSFLKADTDIPLLFDQSWWLMIFLHILSTFMFGLKCTKKIKNVP